MYEWVEHHPAVIQSLAVLIHNLQCWQRRRSTPSRAADMAKPRPLVAVAYPHFRGMICASHDSSKSQDPLSHHAATLTIRRDPFATHAQNSSHRAAGPIFWNNYHDLSDFDNSTLPGRSSGTRNYKSNKALDPCPHVEKTRRTIHNRRSRGLSVSDSIRQGGLLPRAAPSHPDTLRLKTSIQLD